MNWIDIKERLPQFDQTYVISVTKGNYTFKAVAFYETATNLWFYSVEGEKDKQIHDQINGWVENLGIYTR